MTDDEILAALLELNLERSVSPSANSEAIPEKAEESEDE